MFDGGTYQGLVLIIALRYFMIAGIAFAVWYKLIRNKVLYKKIQTRLPATRDYRREILYSIVTIAIFAAVPTLMLQTSIRQYTQFYTEPGEHSLLWFWLAFPLMFLVHDTYFIGCTG